MGGVLKQRGKLSREVMFCFKIFSSAVSNINLLYLVPTGRQQTSKEASPTIMTADETEYSASETNTCSSSDSQPMSLPCQDLGTRQETSSSVTTDEETSVGSERSEEQAPVHVTNSFISEVTRLQTTSTVTRHEDLPSGREGIPKESRGMLGM